MVKWSKSACLHMGKKISIIPKAKCLGAALAPAAHCDCAAQSQRSSRPGFPTQSTIQPARGSLACGFWSTMRVLGAVTQATADGDSHCDTQHACPPSHAAAARCGLLRPIALRATFARRLPSPPLPWPCPSTPGVTRGPIPPAFSTPRHDAGSQGRLTRGTWPLMIA